MNISERIVQENIYRDAIERIESLLSETTEGEPSDARITKLYQGAKSKLSFIKEDLLKELCSLQEHAEWDSFTVAFYGETNAGKSTLIETLRILLREETKINERAIFDDAYTKLIDLQCKYSEIIQEIQIIQNERDCWVQTINKSIDETIKDLDAITEKQKYSAALIEANNLARADLRTNSAEDFFKVLFGRDTYSKENASLRGALPKLKLEYNECKSKLDRYRDRYKKEIEDFNKKIEPLESERTILNQDMMPLGKLAENHRDGQIIGTGRQDYTQEVTEYTFSINNQRLTLIDLPGIEGKESQYLDLIASALEKAHAVFYISKFPRPPQNGEDEISMISKVGKQLSGQTEVFFVYNKPAQNPKQIEALSSISDDELESLRDVDDIMTSLLGDNYSGHLVVSAMPAYLAKSNNYGEDETAKKLKKRQVKFLMKFTPEELIINSNIDSITTWLEKNLASDYREKIKDANYYKIINSLNRTEKQVETLENQFKDLRDVLSNELISSFKAIDARLNSMINELRDVKRTVSYQFIFKSNEVLSEVIDNGVDDDELTETVKIVFEAKSKDAIDLYNRKLKELGDIYAKDVADINNKYQKYFSENIIVFNDTSKLGFDYKPVIEKHPIKSDDAAWIIGEVIGALLFISTSSTAVLVMTILGLIISVGRFIAKSFDPERNKAYQRQDLDQNVKNAASELEKTLQEHNEIVIKKIEDNNKIIKDRMKKSLREMEVSLTDLENVRKGINTIHEEYRNGGKAIS